MRAVHLASLPGDVRLPTMKIGLVYDAVYPWVKGGGEKHLWEMALAMQRRGHEVHCFGMKFWAGAKSIERDGVWLHGVCRARKLYNVAGKRTALQPVIFAAGLFLTLLRNPAGKMDVIDSIAFPYFSLFAIAVWRKLARSRTAWVITWLEVWGPDYWQRYLKNNANARFGAWIERACSRLSDRHLCISRHQAARLRELLSVPPELIEVVPCGVNLSELPSARSNPARLLYLGRLLDYKNVDVVVRAMPEIHARFPKVRLRIVGDGPHQLALRALISELKMQSVVEFFPGKPEAADALEEIAEATILVQPSTREGLSMVVLEAQGIGTPVVAALHRESAVSDLIENGRDGILIANWDKSEAWAAAIIRLLEDRNLCAYLAANGREAARQFDSESVILPRMEEFYERLRSDCSVA